MQSVLSGIWTRVAVFISYDDNHYTTGTSKKPNIQSTSCCLGRWCLYVTLYLSMWLQVQYEGGRAVFYNKLTSGRINPADFFPIDYHVWGTVEQEISKTLFNSKNELKVKITEAFTNVNRETAGRTCRIFWNHQDTVFKVKRDYFELIQSQVFPDIFR